MSRHYELVRERCIGTVKWFNTERGYGFVVPEDDTVIHEAADISGGTQDVFFHTTDMQGIAKPQTGDRIEFDLAFSPEKNKAVAINVNIVEYRK